MITLPDWAIPNGATPSLVDFGMIMRPATGAAVTRIERPGSRFRIDFGFPPMKADNARIVVSRLLQAKSDGLRIEYPLAGISQGNPGLAVTVDGGTAAGTSLPLKGLAANYTVKEGYWLTVIDADGVHYLHNVRATVAASAGGLATLAIWPALRAELVNNNVVLLAKPLVEGLVTSDVSWPLTPVRLVSLAFSLEEAA